MDEDAQVIVKGLTKEQIQATSHLSDYMFGCWLLRYLHIVPARQQGKAWLGKTVRAYLKENTNG